MTLAAGTKLGPYEIQAPLGAGGWERSIVASLARESGVATGARLGKMPSTARLIPSQHSAPAPRVVSLVGGGKPRPYDTNSNRVANGHDAPCRYKARPL